MYALCLVLVIQFCAEIRMGQNLRCAVNTLKSECLNISHLRCGGSFEMWWVIGDVVGNWTCGGSFEMWWLI